MNGSVSPGMLNALGGLCLGWYLVSGGEGGLKGHWEDFLWTCVVGLLGVAVGLLTRSATLSAIGVLWVAFGSALWVLELLGGRPWKWFSMVTHGGGLIAGLIAVRSFGCPRGVWWKSVLGLLALQQLTRWVTPEAANVNLAFRVHEGWEETFPTYGHYLAFLIALGSVSFFVGQLLLRRFVAPAEEGPCPTEPVAATLRHDPPAPQALEDHAPPAQGAPG